MPIFHGTTIREAMKSASVEKIPLIEEFLHEKKVMLISGEPGAGKSIVSMQIAMALSSGTPLFGLMNIPKPQPVYYLQLEGSEEESFERMQRMEQQVPFNENLFWLDYRLGLDLLERNQADDLVASIRKSCKPALIIIDPLYQCIFGELSKELPIKVVTRFIDRLRKEFDPCAILLIHHTTKPSYDSKGQKIEQNDPYYGSQWLKAHVDISYLLKRAEGPRADRVTLFNKKSRGGDVLQQIMLHYDPETDTVTTQVPDEERSGEERVALFLRRLKKEGKTTDFYGVQEACKVSVRHLRKIQRALLAKGILRCNKYMENKKIWEPV